MKCIDAIEGTVKCILKNIHEVSLEDRMDDSEYVRSVKAVIDATDNFVEGNREIIPDRDLLKNVLYSYSKDLWRSAASTTSDAGHPPSSDGLTAKKNTTEKENRDPDKAAGENDGYRDYYFDYLYRHGVYPR
jgi:hypothetical protein